MTKLSKSDIKDVQRTASEWHYVQLNQFYPQINRALKLDTLQRAYNDAAISFWNVKRLQLLQEHDLGYIPKPALPREGNKYVKPVDIDSVDWRWRIIGRPPRFVDYCCHSACHWLSVPNFLLASHLFPEIDWSILSSERHTSVVSMNNQLLFDLNYFALQVSPSDALKGIFGPTFKVKPDFYPDGSDYSYLIGTAGIANPFWELADRGETDYQTIMSHVLQFT